MTVQPTQVALEGPSLDFKKQQYKFVQADEREKSKLLKDILAFANAWRTGDAHILIGVEDVQGGRSVPIGLDADVDDAQLQQFVKSKTNRPVEFHYEVYLFEGKRIGIITILKQQRPFYAKQGYGELVKANEVYYRTGSSCSVAAPEEIARMGAADAAEHRSDPVIAVEFADLERHQPLGQSIELKTIWHESCDPGDYPDAGSQGGSGFAAALVAASQHLVNRNYWRELAYCLLVMKSCRPVSLVVTNTSSRMAENIRIQFEYPKFEGAIFIDSTNYPDRPDYERSLYPNLPGRTRPILIRNKTKVEDHGDRWTVTVYLDSIQPKAKVWAAEPFYVGSNMNQEITLDATVFADNIGQPQHVKLKIQFEVEQRPALTMDELRADHEEHRDD